jgi:peptide/nickel transport system permease protein
MNPKPKGIPPKNDSCPADDSSRTDRPSPKRNLRLGATCWIGISILLVWLFVALFGPLLAPYPQGEMISYDSFAPMGEVGILGGDYIGRDIFSRLLFGARMTMGLALIATVLAFVLGGAFGFLAAAGGGWVDQVLSRLNDAIMAFPSIMLALIVIAALGTSIPVLIIMVCLIEATPVFRLTRALGMDISVMDFVEAARARGENISWIVRREIFPNTMVPLAAEFGLRYTYSILFISALSFLGLGVQPPQADWGVMVRENMIGLTYGSPAAVIPAAAIGSLTVAINLIVDAFVEHGNRDVSEEMI